LSFANIITAGVKTNNIPPSIYSLTIILTSDIFI